MKALTAAIERERWDLVALLLAYAFLKVADSLPPDAVHGLLEALEGMEDEQADV